MKQNGSQEGGIREPIVEGLFYPETAEKLALAVKGFLAASNTPEDEALGILCPHAAYEFTGSILADAFRSAALGKPKRIIILGTVHREESEELYLPESRLFKTSLGTVEVDQQAVNALLDANTLFSTNDIPHLEEHSIEAVLPFVQELFPGVPIVPILIGKNTRSVVHGLASGLRLYFGAHEKDTLYILSSNLGPYLPMNEAEKLAATFLDLLKRCDWKGILQGCHEKTIQACGAGGAAALLSLYEGRIQSTLLSRRASNIQPHTDRTVQYAAVRFDLRDN